MLNEMLLNKNVYSLDYEQKQKVFDLVTLDTSIPDFSQQKLNLVAKMQFILALNNENSIKPCKFTLVRSATLESWWRPRHSLTLKCTSGISSTASRATTALRRARCWWLPPSPRTARYPT